MPFTLNTTLLYSGRGLYYFRMHEALSFRSYVLCEFICFLQDHNVGAPTVRPEWDTRQ